MKRLWIGAGLLAVLLLLGIGSTLAMNRIHSPIARQLDSACEAAIAGHWQEARILTAGARGHWENYKEFAACITDHDDLERADAQFARLDTLQRVQASAAFAAVCAELSAMFDALAEMQDLNLWNMM